MNVAFINENTLGHTSYLPRYAAALRNRPDLGVTPHLLDVLPLPAHLRRLGDTSVRGLRKFGLDFGGTRWRIAISRHGREQLDRLRQAHRMDAVVVNTQSAGLRLADLAGEIPVLAALDATFQQLADSPWFAPNRLSRWLQPITLSRLRREERRLFAASARLLPWSDLPANSLRNDYGIPADRISVLPPSVELPPASPPPAGYERWLQRNVGAHRVPGLRAVTLSLKRAGLPPGDVTAEQMERAAALAERYSAGELRVSHDQNLLLPWVRAADLPALWAEARALGLATPNVGLLTDMIACPGGDLCALANARSIPIAAAIQERFDDLDLLHDIGEIDLHMSGCINSCGHHHSGHIGILGVDKDGSEWYQITLGGSDGSTLSGAAVPGKVIGPSFSADEVADAVEAVIDTYLRERAAAERFVDTVRRLGVAAFRAAADAVRRETAAHEE